MILSVCDGAEVLKTARIVKIIINFIRVLVPIILIVTGMITFTKATADGENKKAMQSLIRKIVAAVIILMVPTLVAVVFKVIDQKREYYSCLENANQAGIDNAYARVTRLYISAAKESLQEYDYNEAVNSIDEIKDDSKKQELLNEMGELKTYFEIKKEIEELSHNYDSERAKEINAKIENIKDEKIKNALVELMKKVGVGQPLNLAPGTYLQQYNGNKYYVTIPEGATTNMPLITYFVGGNPHSSFANPNSIMKTEPMKSVLSGIPFTAGNFIFIYPDYTADSSRSFMQMKELIDYAALEYKCDPEKKIITGVSNGAVITFWLAYTYPKSFSAVVPICGPAYGYTVLSNEYNSKANALVGVPFWSITAGRGDFGSYENKSKNLIAKIHQISPSSKALYASNTTDFAKVIKSELGKSPTNMPNIGRYVHCTVMAYYQVPEFWEWMLTQ